MTVKAKTPPEGGVGTEPTDTAPADPGTDTGGTDPGSGGVSP